MPRTAFYADLLALNEKLVSMGASVSDALRLTVTALADRDADLANEVIVGDLAINQAEREIEEQCLILLASQQPVARDLRTILAVSSIASELERMGDHAKGIAVLALRLIDQPMLKPLIDIPRMAEISREMLRGQLQAFLDGDVEAARRLAARDSEVDQLNDQVFRELLVIMMADPRTITRATYLLWVAHNIERFADRTINIGERVVFLMTGVNAELNGQDARPGLKAP